jgi:hypothetical protein
MRVLAVFSVAIVVFLSLPNTSSSQGRPGAPGRREAERQMNQRLEPPLEPRARTVSGDKLKLQASEIAQLSAELPSQLSLVSRGSIPKDLADKLKRIEKLAKHLREELTR